LVDAATGDDDPLGFFQRPFLTTTTREREANIR
jgi:hypothetical protein